MLTIKKKDLEYLPGPMEENTRDNGLKESNLVRDNLQVRMEYLGKGFGWMEEELNGRMTQ